MREIKLKAFDKVAEEIYDVGYIDFANKVLQVAMIKGGICYGTYVRGLNDVALLQYTGLKDKEGKEIYEGDVISVFEWNRKYKVVFERGMFKASGSTTFSLVTATNGELSCQVIGNIYENPELLKN